MICFQSIANTREKYPEWVAGGRTTLILKPGPFSSENQRLVACLNTVVVQPLEEDSQYKFRGILENVRQEERRTLECAKKTYLQRLSVIWSNPLSDADRVVAFNQYFPCGRSIGR